MTSGVTATAGGHGGGEQSCLVVGASVLPDRRTDNRWAYRQRGQRGTPESASLLDVARRTSAAIGAAIGAGP